MITGEACTLPQKTEGLQRAHDGRMAGFTDGASKYFCHLKPSVSLVASFGVNVDTLTYMYMYVHQGNGSKGNCQRKETKEKGVIINKYVYEGVRSRPSSPRCHFLFMPSLRWYF